MIIKRSFHPIGRGAFYTEQIGGVNIVYDCGSVTARDKIEDNIRLVFTKTDTIEYLFISHFDEDHVRYLQELKDSCKEVKNVVLPLLYKEYKGIFLEILDYKLSEPDLTDDRLELLSLVKEITGDPSTFFKSKVLYQRGYSIQDDDRMETVIGKEELENLDSESVVDSKVCFELDLKSLNLQHKGNLIHSWYLIPYNHNHKERAEEVLAQLSSKYNKVFTVESLISDLQRLIDDRKVLKSVYNTIEKSINHNSLLLLSVPICYHCENTKTKNTLVCHLKKDIRIGCLYTGDSSFKLTKNKPVEIWEIFKEHWDKIGTIQVPHHGSINEWNKDFLVHGTFNCVVSSASTDKKHPNTIVVEDIDNSTSTLYYSNEKKGYYQEYQWTLTKEPVLIK